MTAPIRVLVVDDSALMRKLIPQMLERDGSIQVVATAMDGDFALKKIDQYHPDAITLDLEMPRVDGIETLRRIMHQQALPIVVISSHTRDAANTTFKALHLGAFDFVAKPVNFLETSDELASEMIAKIKAAVACPPTRLPQPWPSASKPAAKPRQRRKVPPSKVVAIGLSTGGPNALEYLLAQLPADFPAAILVVQHMPAGFTAAFARRLDESCALDVKEAGDGDLLTAGQVFICPGDYHMQVRRTSLGEVLVLSRTEGKLHGHRPSVDVLFRSVATLGSAVIGVLMTGMGEDGAAGLGALQTAGALTLAQDEASCVVFGMPRAAIERGFAQRVVPLEAMASTLTAYCCAPRTVTGQDQFSAR